MVFMMLESVRKAYTNSGLSAEKPLPEIMIELPLGLVESESKLIGTVVLSIQEDQRGKKRKC